MVTEVTEEKRHPLNTNEKSPMRILSPLVEPLVRLTRKKDLIVICVSGTLHGMPLHAATIAEDPDTTLIERNPIVYTANMTVLEQCTS